MDRKTLEVIDVGNKAIWEAILYVISDRIQETVKVGQKGKADRLRNLLVTLEAKK